MLKTKQITTTGNVMDNNTSDRKTEFVPLDQDAGKPELPSATFRFSKGLVKTGLRAGFGDDEPPEVPKSEG